MPRVFVGNFDFEQSLLSGTRQLTREAQVHAADLVSTWIALADADDVIWSPTGTPKFEFRDLQALGIALPRFVSTEAELPRGGEWELVPWGWTSQLVAWGRSRGWSCPAPPDEVVRLVNSRIFRWELEDALGVALPGSAVITSADQLLAHIAQHAAEVAGWVLKANYGMAGRERSLGRGPRVAEHILNWAKKRFAQSEGLVYEPWLDRVAEAGLQWDIPTVGDPLFMGITPLLTDASGTYRGSRVACPDEELFEWQPAVEITRSIARRLQQCGYWGPLGIDAMRYRQPSGEILLRPLQDLNARFTMGRIALGLRRFVPPGYTADWLHDTELVAQAANANPRTKVIQTTARSWLVMYESGAASRLL